MSSRTILFGIYTLCLLAAGVAVLGDLVAFSVGNATASHVVLIPFVVAALIHQNRRSVFATVQAAVPAGTAVILGGLGLLLLGTVHPVLRLHGNALSVSVGGLVTAWVGGFLAFYGFHAMRAALFPLLFLGFTIPMPSVLVEGATRALKAGSAEAVAALLSLTGTPYLREGFVFSLPGFAIEIADECSGIRSSIALLLTGLLASQAFLRTPWAKMLVLLVVLPVTVLKNAIRIVSLVLLATHVDPEFLTGQLHHEGGIVFFALSLGLLIPVVLLVRRCETTRAERLQTAAS